MRVVLAVIATLALAGCYELPHPIFNQGEHAAIAGTYECSGMMQTRRDTIRENATGLIWKDYRYTNAANETLTLRKLSGTLYAAEIKTTKAISVAFLDIPGPDHFSIRLPDLIQRTRQLDALITARHVNARPSQTNLDFVALSGTDHDLVSFITAHTADLLTTVATCNRVSS